MWRGKGEFVINLAGRRAESRDLCIFWQQSPQYSRKYCQRVNNHCPIPCNNTVLDMRNKYAPSAASGLRRGLCPFIPFVTEQGIPP
jgi:hypothetical protein